MLNSQWTLPKSTMDGLDTGLEDFLNRSAQKKNISQEPENVIRLRPLITPNCGNDLSEASALFTMELLGLIDKRSSSFDPQATDHALALSLLR